MDNYNHMMDSDYGNIVYGSGMPGQIHNNLPPEGMLLQNNDGIKDIQEQQQQQEHYVPRESIITTGGHLENVYEQQPAPAEPPDLLQNMENGTENCINESKDNADASEEPIEQSLQEQEPVTEESTVTAPIVNADNKEDEPTVEAAASNEDENNSTGEIKTAILKIEPLTQDAEEASTEGGGDVSSIVETVKKEATEIDQNQCRVCLSKSELINIFTYENDLRICDIIMTVCTVKIAERDFLPHYLCTDCLTKVKVASDFKKTCEQTDKDLRQKLKRSKNKSRTRTRDFILVDCEMSSGSDNDAKDDDEFHISSAENESEPDSDASFTVGKRKRPSRTKKPSHKKKSPEKRSRARPTSATTPASSSRNSRSTRNSRRASPPAIVKSASKRLRHDVVFVQAPPLISDEDDDEEDDQPIAKRGGRQRSAPAPTTPASKKKGATPRPKAAPLSKQSSTPSAPKSSSNKSSKIPHKKRAIEIKVDSDDEDDDDDDDEVSEVTTTSGGKRREWTCGLCNQVFQTSTALKEHKKVHIGEKPLACNICQKPFKQKTSLEAHIQKHKDDDSRTCKPCDKQFASRMDLRKHQQTEHEDEFTFECDKCKRTFTTKARLDKHVESKCPGFDTTVVKKKPEGEVSTCLGKDLFKCVAPLTTTYWSDSFSD